jgi:hypothetical protein
MLLTPLDACSHAPVGDVCGFDLSAFQRLADTGSGRHGGIFPYAMSEYSYTELTAPVPILTANFTRTVEDLVCMRANAKA